MTDGCPRNLCECDKRFAERIAELDDTCQTLKADEDPTNDLEGGACQRKEYYTKTSSKISVYRSVPISNFNVKNLKI